MQNKLLPVLVAATLLTCGAARAQDATIATPSSPAPASQSSVAASNPQALPTPNQIIYAPRLPSANELTAAAAAQGLSVEQINQTSNQITVVYRTGTGQTNTVSYQLLPSGAPTATAAPATTTTVVVPQPAPTVIYETAPSVVYYETYRPYYPRSYYYTPPVSLSLGFGYYHGWGGHGGWHHR